MNKRTILFASTFISLMIFMVVSCSKEDNTNNNNNENNTPGDTTNLGQGVVEQEMAAQSVYSDATAQVLSNGDANTSKGTKGTCPTVTLEPTTGGYPKTLTIDFGDVSAPCTVNGRQRSGTITATLSGKIREKGTTISISFHNYKIDTIEVGGTASLTVNQYQYAIGNSEITYTSTVTNGLLTMPTGTINYNMTRTVIWNMGVLTNYLDDEFNISSTSSGKTIHNITFTSETTQDLLVKADCAQPVSGVLSVTSSEIPYPATIDFGNGDCDAKATVSTTVSVTIADSTYTSAYSYDIVIP